MSVVQDFFSYQDVTDRYRVYVDIIDKAVNLDIDHMQRSAIIASTFNKIMQMGDAPTKQNISRELIEMGEMKDEMEKLFSAIGLMQRSTEISQEVESYEKSE